MGTRTSRINALRGFCREFGIAIPVGARTGVEAMSRVLADPHTAVPDLIRGTAKLLIEEIRLLEGRIAQLERELAALAKLNPACTTLLCYATLRDKEPFGESTVRLNKKISRESFVMPV